MPEVAASDFAFVFKGTGNRLIALWTRESQLAATGKFKTMFHLPNVPNAESSSSSTKRARISQNACTMVPEFSLVAHCALIRYLETGDLERQISLRHFFLTVYQDDSPDQPKQWGGDIVEELRKDPLRLVSWRQVYHLALRYGLVELQKLCASNL
ncbi:hypothetical protein BGZ74_000120 [Mortierella antarctica]|nr:hypothetical protein BGZ74_000120 [Mortierella antarctica]